MTGEVLPHSTNINNTSSGVSVTPTTALLMTLLFVVLCSFILTCKHFIRVVYDILHYITALFKRPSPFTCFVNTTDTSCLSGQDASWK